MPRRKWTQWPRRFGKALTETGGVVGLVGLGLSAVGATGAGPVVLGIGGVTVGSSLLYAGWRAVPPKMQSATELVGKNVSLRSLEAIDPPILKLGIVGYTQAGKTTFLQKALHREPGTTRTNKVYAAVLSLQMAPTTYIALLDGDGEQLPQQFEVAEHADFLLVFLDHSQADDNIAKSKDRLEDHDRFLQQLEFQMKRRGQLRHLHFVLNKRDLWERSKSAAELQQWLTAHAKQFQRANVAADTTADIHSNMVADDIGKLVRLISEGAASA